MEFIKAHGLVFIAVLAALFTASCSVKEDREPCPAYLMVSFSDRGHIDSEVGLMGWSAAKVFCDTIDVADYDPYWVKTVRKEPFFFSAFRNSSDEGSASLNNHYVTSPYGSQADSLYAFHTQVEPSEEVSYVDVSFKKQFCTVYLDVRKSVNEMRSYTFTINCNTRGFDVLTFDPVPGPMHFTIKTPEGERIVPFRIYRQMDDELSVTVFDRGAIIGTFDVGDQIRKTGYNWDEDNLQDVYILLDIVSGEVSITVVPWEEGMYVDFKEQ